NRRHPPTMLGLHDLFEPQDPPNRREIHVYTVSDRIGSPILVVPPEKIAGIVETNLADEFSALAPGDSKTAAIGRHVAEFLIADMRAGSIPKRFLPVQSGIGAVANAVFKALGEVPEIPPFEMYSEVLQDAVIELIQEERCTFASGTALTVTPEVLDQITGNIAFFRRHLILRPQEISNSPEIVRRLGIISINTALEVDLFGNVNSYRRHAHRLHTQTLPAASVRHRRHRLSTIVPLVTHVDHSEHSVQVVVTEWGVADLRGKDERERAQLIINNCAHPDYRDELQIYVQAAKEGHPLESLTNAFAMHRQFLKTGDMRGTQWN